MKTTVLIILLVVILQARASFYDDIAGAMDSVEKAFGKLLNDVVTDVKNTVHCTILAMEQVLAISGALNESTTNSECYDSSESSYNPSVATEKYIPGIFSENDINEQLSSSISKMNETLTNIFDNDGHERLREIKKVLQNETDRLTEVSRLLRQELEKISNSFKNKYENINSNMSSLESLWNNMKILHNLEINDKNASEVNEIGQVLNEAMNVLHVNTTTNLTTDEDKIKVIMQELENESYSNNTTRKKIENELSEWNYLQPTYRNYSDYDMSPPNLKILKDINKFDETIHNYTSNTSTLLDTKLSVEKMHTFSPGLGLIHKNSTDSTDSVTTDIDSIDSDLSGRTTTNADSTDAHIVDTEIIDSDLKDSESIGSPSTNPNSNTADINSIDFKDAEDTVNIDLTDSDTYLKELDLMDGEPIDSSSIYTGLDIEDADTEDTADAYPLDIDSIDSDPTYTYLKDFGLTDNESVDLSSTDTDLDIQDTDTIDLDSADFDTEERDSIDSGFTDTDLTSLGLIDKESEDLSFTDTDLETEDTGNITSDSANADMANSDSTKIPFTDSGLLDSTNSTDTDFKDPGLLDSVSTYSDLFDTSNQADLTSFDLANSESTVGALSKEEHKQAVNQAKEIIANNSNMEVTLNKLFANSGNNYEFVDFDGRK